ncbi:MAG: hypothetical protein M3O70_28630 [Actinomycetota bacterium]|nr:hypothetical protein [Actinomycetota bacterium]
MPEGAAYMQQPRTSNPAPTPPAEPTGPDESTLHLPPAGNPAAAAGCRQRHCAGDIGEHLVAHLVSCPRSPPLQDQQLTSADVTEGATSVGGEITGGTHGLRDLAAVVA